MAVRTPSATALTLTIIRAAALRLVAEGFSGLNSRMRGKQKPFSMKEETMSGGPLTISARHAHLLAPKRTKACTNSDSPIQFHRASTLTRITLYCSVLFYLRTVHHFECTYVHHFIISRSTYSPRTRPCTQLLPTASAVAQLPQMLRPHASPSKKPHVGFPGGRRHQQASRSLHQVPRLDRTLHRGVCDANEIPSGARLAVLIGTRIKE